MSLTVGRFGGDPEHSPRFKLSVLEQLEEFRKRLIRAAIGVGIGVLVAFAAIKGLNTKVEDKSKALEARLSELESRVAMLEQALISSRNFATSSLGIGMALIGVPAVAIRAFRRRR